MNHTSALNWDHLSSAQRLQEKLHRYFDLVEQIRALEEDPELRAALQAVGGISSSVPEVVPSAAPVAEVGERSPMAATVEKRRVYGDSERLLALAQPGERFDAHFLLSRAKEQGSDLATMTPKKANDHLRRFASAGRIHLEVPGKRGQSGTMPVYQLVTGGTSAAKDELDLDSI
jgi:hypothetical protein